MNKRDYAGALDVLDKAHDENPGNKKVSRLLIQAHLGLSGFGALDFAKSVFKEQNPSVAMDLVLKPVCGNEAISDKIDKYATECLLIRILQHLPSAEGYHFKKSQELFRTYFPDPAKEGNETNFLGAVIELTAAMSRLSVILQSDPNGDHQFLKSKDAQDVEFKLIVHNVKLASEELQLAIGHLKHSYKSFSDFIVLANDKPLFRFDGHALGFVEAVNIHNLVNFLSDVVHDTINHVDHKKDVLISRESLHLESIINGIIKIIDAEILQKSSSSNHIWNKLIHEMIHLELHDDKSQHHAEVLSNLIALEHIWNKPPKDLVELLSSLSSSWESENPSSLREYFEIRKREVEHAAAQIAPVGAHVQSAYQQILHQT